MVTSAQPTSPSPPPIGALIDNGALELVEILGYGGYGIVYRAIDTYSSHPTSYAVKCLPHSNKRSSTRQRQLHIREITLHKLASAHPGVVTLHRVIEDSQYTWIVMDYCGDGDLFTQILHNRRYLGQNDLIREVFLQLLDAVDYCHSLNIYHRDLKPENILCFEDGLRLAITDFGLATTEKMSTEFRTGSVYHMSPECQGGDFAPTKSYSPLFNDIWSLGIILLNLITGRNPWKSASIDDCTFQAYLRDPVHFLPTVLPISQEVNALLVRVLHVDWRHRMTLHEMRQAVKDIENFYSPDVLFEDSMARCPWEAGVNVDDDEEAESDSTGPTAEPEHETQAQDFLVEDANRQSQWSENSDSEMVFTTQSATKHSWEESTYDDENSSALYRGRSGSPASPLFSRRPFDDVRSSSGPSTYSVVSSSPSIPSPPVTPGPEEVLFPGAARRPAHLTLDIDGLHNEYYAGSINMLSATDESMMQTAIESARYTDFETYSPFFYPESNKPSAIEPSSEMLITPTDYGFDDDEMDAMSSYSYAPAEDEQSISMPEPMSARPESPVLGLGLGFSIPDPAAVNQQPQPAEPSTDVAAPTPAYSFLSFPTPDTTQYNSPFTFPSIPNTNAFTPVSTTLGSPFEYTPPASSSFSSKPSSRRSRSRSRKSRLLNPMRLAFTRRSRSPTPPVPQTSTATHEQSFQDGSSPNFPTHWSLAPSTSPEHAQLSCFATPASSPKVSGSAITSTAVEKRVTQGIRRRTATKKRLRSPRDWFSPGKLLAAVIPSP